jgi:lipoprotein-anchoring transpeptidase ErfK/SrfK
MPEVIFGGLPRGPTLTRRVMVRGVLAAAAASAMPETGFGATVESKRMKQAELDYGPLPDEPFPIPAVDVEKLEPKYFRRVVDDPTGELAGTVVVDTHDRVLYLTLEAKRAVRYAIGVGRAGFAWSGRGEIKLTTGGDDRAAAGARAISGRHASRARKSAWCAGAVYLS